MEEGAEQVVIDLAILSAFHKCRQIQLLYLCRNSKYKSMPKGADWLNFIFVNLGFIAQIFAMYYFSAIKEIKENWPLYRCNPAYWPLSDNIEEDFVYCIQNTQMNFMGYLLEPLNYIVSSLGFLGTEFTESLQAVRVVIANIRTFVTSITENILGIFLNIITEFLKITLGIKDLVGKLIGTVVTLLYLIEGSVDAGVSFWDGPIGQSVRALCFHPETKVELMDGRVLPMNELLYGDVLLGGSKIDVVFRLHNAANEPLYRVQSKTTGEYVYVTGEHMIYSSAANKFIKVKDHPDSVAQTDIQTEWLYSFLTSDHRIRIGEYEFWDWDDAMLTK